MNASLSYRILLLWRVILTSLLLVTVLGVIPAWGEGTSVVTFYVH